MPKHRAPRLILLHGIAKAGKFKLFGHRMGLLDGEA
jgi:hypothetical protein